MRKIANDVEKRITAKMVLDSTGFNNSLKGVNQQLQLAQTEFKAGSERVGIFGKDTEKLRYASESLSKQIELQRQKVDIWKESISKATDKMNDNIKARDELKDKLQELGKTHQEIIKLYGKDSEEAQKSRAELKALGEEYKRKGNLIESSAKQINYYTIQTNKADEGLAKMQSQLKKTNDELARSESGWLKASSALKDGSDKLIKVGSSVSSAGDKVLALSAPLVGLGIAAGKVGMDFDSQMSRVKAISSATAEEFKKLNEQALQLGADTAFSSKEAALGMENLASAGFSVSEIMAAMPGMLDLAASSGEDLATSADIAASTLRGFGLAADQAGHVADVLARNAADTNASVADTGEAMKYIAPIARAMGLSLEEVTAAIGEMANAGIKGSQAGTTLRGALSRLADPSKESAKAMKQIGFNAFDSQGKLLPLRDLIDRLQKSTKNLTDKQKEQAMSTIFGQEAMSGMLTLIQAGPQELEKLTNSYKNSNGAAKEMANTMQDNAKSSVEQMFGSIETAGIKLEQTFAPTIKKVADYIGDLADRFSQLSPETQESIVKALGMTVALGGLLKVGGGVIGTVGNIAGGISKITGVMGVASVASAGVAGATGVASAGVGGLALAAKAGALLLNPWVLGIGAATLAGVGLYKTLQKDVIPEVDLFADKIEYTAKVVDDSYSDMSTQIETNTIKISESTKKAVGAYVKMDDDVTKTLNGLYINSTKITSDTASSLTSKYREMGNQIKQGMDTKYKETYDLMKDFYTKSGVLTDEEEKKTLEGLKANNEAKKVETDKYLKEIQVILKNASDNNRALSQEEQQTINSIQEKMKQQAVQNLSQTELESKVIMERMKSYGTRVSAEQAAEIIKNANSTRDNAVKAANEQYDKTVAAVIKMRDESKIISADQAQKLIDEATRQRDESITKAEEMRSGVVGKLKEMNPEVEKEVNLQTGTLKTKWEQFKDWWNNVFHLNKKTAEVETRYTSSGGNPYGAFDIGANATGTSYWRGGLTTLHEKGYEVYDLPRGTRIYNHEASQDLAMKTATEVARSVLSNIDVGSSGTQAVIVPVYLDGKVIAEVTSPYSNRIQGSNVKFGGRGQGIK